MSGKTRSWVRTVTLWVIMLILGLGLAKVFLLSETLATDAIASELQAYMATHQLSQAGPVESQVGTGPFATFGKKRKIFRVSVTTKEKQSKTLWVERRTGFQTAFTFILQ